MIHWDVPNLCVLATCNQLLDYTSCLRETSYPKGPCLSTIPRLAEPVQKLMLTELAVRLWRYRHATINLGSRLLVKKNWDCHCSSYESLPTSHACSGPTSGIDLFRAVVSVVRWRGWKKKQRGFKTHENTRIISHAKNPYYIKPCSGWSKIIDSMIYLHYM